MTNRRVIAWAFSGKCRQKPPVGTTGSYLVSQPLSWNLEKSFDVSFFLGALLQRITGFTIPGNRIVAARNHFLDALML
jgi:hypothetical protein